jgi:hypothetical protein
VNYLGDFQLIEYVYPDCKHKDYFSSPGDYLPLLKSFNYNIIIQLDDSDYQGETRILYDNEGKIGHLQFSWGSCSGCDSLQACNSYKELDELRNQLHKDIVWYDDKSLALNHFENSYNIDCDNEKEFKKLVIEYLKKE